MDIRIAETYEYTPEWKGNRDEESPITVVIRHLTEAQREKCISARLIGDGAEVKTNQSELVRIGVISIDNLSINGQKITNGHQLCQQYGVLGLIQELAGRVLESLTEGIDTKN